MANTAFICFPAADYTHNAAISAARRVLAQRGWIINEGDTQAFSTDSTQPCIPSGQNLYLADYDLLPFQDLLPAPSPSTTLSLCSSYVIRKALIRKHYLASALHSYSVKSHDPARYQSCTPKTWPIEIQFADELDELLLDDLYDLNQALEHNQALINREQHRDIQWFILKPGMADRGNGIRLFSTAQQLEQIFHEFEPESDDDNDDHNERDVDQHDQQAKDTRIIASQLRHFVVQEYLSYPLLIQPPAAPSHLSSEGPRKFHLRAYVLCSGALSVYLHDDMLALFAPLPYSLPSEQTMADLRCHLTNTCLQQDGSLATGNSGRPKEENVFLWNDLVSDSLTAEMISTVKGRAVKVISDTFEAVAKAGSVHWQLWPNAFEIFGVDLLVDVQLGVKLLEINAQPDFAQTGTRLSAVIDHLFERTCQIAVLGYHDNDLSEWKVGESRCGTTLCFREQLSKAW